MQKRHVRRKQYSIEQGTTIRRYVIPYIEKFKALTEETRLLEIGCGIGGNLPPFIEKGCDVVGIDMSPYKMETAKEHLKEYCQNSKLVLLTKDIYDLKTGDIGTFDVIILKDVIEHIPNQNKLLSHLKTFLKPQGIIFFGFPPWCMPFGGHQQVFQSKILSNLPYYHLLPTILYKAILKIFGESEHKIISALEIKETGIGINKFKRSVLKNQYQFVKKTLYLVNPHYEVKFGLKPRKQFKIISSIPYLRDFLTTCFYCIIKRDEIHT